MGTIREKEEVRKTGILGEIYDKRAMSEVIATLILVLLTMAIVGVIWVGTNKIVNTGINSSTSCFNLGGKVTLNNDYTCYNDTGTAKQLVFSINVGDIDNLQDILVGITGSGGSATFKINADSSTSGLLYLNGTGPAGIPGKNHGITYVYPLPAYFTASPDSIEISPIINGNSCEVTDSVRQFDSCSSVAGF